MALLFSRRWSSYLLGLWLGFPTILSSACGSSDAGVSGGSLQLVAMPGGAHRLYKFVAATSAHDLWAYGTTDGVAPNTLVHVDATGPHDVALEAAAEVAVKNPGSSASAGPGAFWVAAFDGSSLLKIDASGAAEDHAAELAAAGAGTRIFVATYESTTYANRSDNTTATPLYKLVNGHFDPLPVLPGGPLLALRVTPDGAAWILFAKGGTALMAGVETVARFDGQAWTELAMPAGTSADLNFAYASTTEVWKTVTRGNESEGSVTPWKLAKYDGTSFQLVDLTSPPDYGQVHDRKHNGLDFMAPLAGGKVAVLGLRQKVAYLAETINVYLEQNAIDGTILANDVTIYETQADCGPNCGIPPVLQQYIDGGNMVFPTGRDFVVGAGG